jgi:hypothetical protein
MTNQNVQDRCAVKSRRSVAAALAVALVLTPVVARADVVLDWNVTMFATLSGQNPFATARFAAITQLAVFEAVNTITGHYRPYLGTVTAAPGASPEAAAAAAAHGVLTFYFPGRAAVLDAALASSLSSLPDDTATADGMAAGRMAAAAMLAARANDGSAVPQFHLPGPPSPGLWQLTPTCPAAGGILLHWRGVTPFGVPAVEQFRLGPPPALTDGKYAKSYDEVTAVGAMDSASRPQDRTDVAFVFGLGLSPTAWSNAAARQTAEAQGSSLSENARAFALLNMALSDSTVAAFDTKYHYNFWRPETAIRAGDMDGNRRTDQRVDFEPLLGTPCFPGYPSAHATVSYAAAEVLERLYGPSGHDITLSAPNVSGAVLHYTTFKSIVQDIDDARVFGGIHFRFDQDAGAHQGTSIGAYIAKHNLRVAHPTSR